MFVTAEDVIFKIWDMGRVTAKQGTNGMVRAWHFHPPFPCFYVKPKSKIAKAQAMTTAWQNGR